VEAIRANLNPDGTYQLGIQPVGKNMQHYNTSVLPDKLDETVGKELAEKIRSGVTESGVDSGKVFSGLDLQVGGEGMKGFYDKMIPDYLNSVGKNYNAKTTSMNLPTPPKNSDDVLAYPLGEEYRAGQVTWPEFMARNPKAAEEFTIPVHSFDMTPELRESILSGGLPTYRKGGPVKRQQYKGIK
jgi:hypothetical protein